MKIKIQAIICMAALSAFSAIVPAQSGGSYAITQSVIAAGGGQNSQGGSYAVDGTIGEAIAGTTSTGSFYAVKGGFWTAGTPAPTAAPVTVGGRVRTADGRGIRSVLITLTDGSGLTRTTFSSAFGHFNFAEVPAGGTYILTASAKRFMFTQPAQVFSITADTNDIIFIGESIAQ